MYFVEHSDQAAELSIPEMHLVKHSWVLGSKDLV